MKYLSCAVLIVSMLNVHSQLPYNHIFDDSKVSSVFIEMDPDSLADMYDHYMNGHEYLATFMFDDGISVDTVSECGIRFRGNTSLSAEKKSFKISFNTYHAGREYSGVKKLNLNGQHNDPSMVREKLYFDVYNDFGLPERRSSFVRLYINGDYFGLYTNIEEMDEIFLRDRFGESSGNLYKCTWPSDLTWHGDGQNYYENGPYDLQTNPQQNDYSDLIHFIDVLNNTPDADFQCEIEKIFDVQNFLKIYALDISAGHWDNYGFNNNNFFLYHNQFTGQFEFLSYDCDNTFGVDWFGTDWAERNIYNWNSDNRPLVEKILAVPEYYDQFSFYIDQLSSGILSEENIFPQIDAYRDLIDDAAFEDEYRTYDYGYSYEDFLNSFDMNDIDGHTPYGVKNFIAARNANTGEQVEISDIFPVITFTTHLPHMPSADNDIQFIVNGFDDQSVATMTLYFMRDGLFDAFEMYDDGLHGDSLANDFIFGVTIPATMENGDFFYHFTIEDNNGHIRQYPLCDNYVLHVGYSPPGIVINECMAINDNTIADDAGEFDDYIEIYNRSDIGIYIGDKFLSDELDNPFKWRMPDMILPADNYLLVWADNEWEEGIYHSTFKLDGDKDEIFIFDNAGTYFSLIDSVSFVNQIPDTSIGRLPNGIGAFTILPEPSPGSNNDPDIDPGIDISSNSLTVISNIVNETLDFNIGIASDGVNTIIELIDISGKTIAKIENGEFNKGSYDYSIAVTSYATGLYFLKAVFDGKVQTKRVVIY